MNKMTEIQEDKLLALFAKSGLRNTSQRRDIYQYLISTPTHPTAKQIFEQLKPNHPTLSLATVYNTLDLLVGAGLITTLGEIGDNQVHFDGETGAHINIACTVCYKIVDLPIEDSGLFDSQIQNSGYLIHGSRVVYYGTCPDCQLKHNQKSKELFTNGN